MDSISGLTKLTLSVLRNTLAEDEPEKHPFAALTAALAEDGRQWDEFKVHEAIKAIAAWVQNQVFSGVQKSSMAAAELLAAARKSTDAEVVAAGANFNGWCHFIFDGLHASAEEIDFDYIAEQLFEDGRKRAASTPTAAPLFKRRSVEPSMN